MSADPKDLVRIYEATNAAEAHLVKILLADEGIEASVCEENEPLAGLGLATIEVLVARADEQRARAVTGQYDAQQRARAERPDWVCPECEVTVIGALDLCDNCGAERPGSQEPEEPDDWE